ncbi:MAG: Tim44/TimA family putative adaptor protein [Rickettsiales bacterium]|nr:Tim44/TimA family putative adaptor protein [Rickettsiales bacterium]
MDIIFFAAIALYVFWRLRGQFGVMDEEEKKQVNERLLRKKEIVNAVKNQLVSIQKKLLEQTEKQKQNEEAMLSSLDSKSQDQFREALRICNISAEFFLNGVKSSFEMVIKSFASEDLNNLKLLLAEKIYDSFEQVINQRRINEQTLVSNVISIDKADIIKVTMLEKTVLVTIKFISKQINYISEKSGRIIDGKKDQITELTDIWTFKKDLTMPNKNWIISAT